MIDAIVFVILVIFAIMLILNFISFTSLLLNLILLVLFFMLIRRDLRDSDNHKYYIGSLILTSLFLILSNAPSISYLLSLVHIFSIITIAVALVYVFANLIGFGYELFRHLKEK